VHDFEVRIAGLIRVAKDVQIRQKFSPDHYYPAFLAEIRIQR
jgi:hypothetical protein